MTLATQLTQLFNDQAPIENTQHRLCVGLASTEVS